jgi:MoaA/NifB/PqqE/SkfB family radical SAM enzyme
VPPVHLTDDPPGEHAGAVVSTSSLSAVSSLVRRAHKRAGVRVRTEGFGAIAYVPDRDQFVALDHAAASLVESVAVGNTQIDDANWPLAEDLARVGVLGIPTISAAHFRPGRSLVGDFPDLPAVDYPLVVNTFATAICPLRCRYCHADDLMQPFRVTETDGDVDLVAATAGAVPAMVAVITGGDPIMRPDRTERLIKALSPEKAIVIDTSGAGDAKALILLLKSIEGHLRVSLDSADAKIHDRLRPINPRYLSRGDSSYAAAWETIERAVRADVATTVQTVVSSANDNPEALIRLARHLVANGVQQWVLHVAVPAGRAAEARNQRLLPGGDVRRLLAKVMRTIEDDAELATLRVRVTATHRNPNAVLLVGSRGDLYIETGPTGKVKLAPSTTDRNELVRLFRGNVDARAHANRYLGGAAPF